MKLLLSSLLALQAIVSASVSSDSVLKIQRSSSHRFIETGGAALESNAPVAFEPIPNIATFETPSITPPESHGNSTKVVGTPTVHRY